MRIYSWLVAAALCSFGHDAFAQIAVQQNGDVELGTAGGTPKSTTTINGNLNADTVSANVLAGVTVSALGQLTAPDNASPNLPVFGRCNSAETTSTCTATAKYPGGRQVKSGWYFYIVPDGTGPAYGICGIGSGDCKIGDTSCSVTTKIEGCAKPGYSRETALVAITCN
jgi:hypothetical protein